MSPVVKSTTALSRNKPPYSQFSLTVDYNYSLRISSIINSSRCKNTSFVKQYVPVNCVFKIGVSVRMLFFSPPQCIRDYAEQQREFRRQIDQRLLENRRLAQKREEERLEEEQRRLEVESDSVASSDLTLDGVQLEAEEAEMEAEAEAAVGEVIPDAEQLPQQQQEQEEEEEEERSLSLSSGPEDATVPSLGFQAIHSPTDEVVPFLSPPTTQGVTILPVGSGEGVVGIASQAEVVLSPEQEMKLEIAARGEERPKGDAEEPKSAEKEVESSLGQGEIRDRVREFLIG